MKKNDWILITAVGLYSFLFYQQTAGINFALFTIALISLLGIKDQSLLKNTNWWLAAVGSLLSSFAIGWYGNTVAVVANIVSLSLLSALSLNYRSSVVLSLLFSFYSYFSSPVFMFLDRIERRKKANTLEQSTIFKKIALVTIPLLITLLFFSMYKASNPLFYDFAKNINLDFISASWVAFTLGGFILLYGFFYHRKIKSLSDLDENASNHLSPDNPSIVTLLGKKLTINEEDFSGKMLFVLLNALLLIVNILDINFLFLGGQLPNGITYAEFVHQGTGTLVTSILIAIAIILFYFRGSLNFYEKNNTIKFLAYFWIMQNAFMLLTTATKNDMYISEYSLTYKRIGVYIYLFLCVLGLATTFIKIMKVKSNHYLFRVNGWLFYAVLIFFCLFNWDGIITGYNISNTKRLDKAYLLELSDTNLPTLIPFMKDTIKEPLDTNTTDSIQNFEERLSERLYDFMGNRKNASWKSWYYDNTRVYNDLIRLSSNKKITTFKLSSYRIQSFEPLKEFNNITEMSLNSHVIKNTRELGYFTELKKLDLKFNNLNNINGLEALENLEWLDISGNPILDYSPIYNLKKLKELHVERLIQAQQYEELQNKLPHTKITKSTI